MIGYVNPTVVYHRTMGATTMNGCDARSAVSQHPREWSLEPWSPAVVARVEALIKRDEELNFVPIVGALSSEQAQ